MRVEVDNGNARIEHNGNDFRIIIPSKKNWLIIIFMIAWLGGWLMGELSVLRVIIAGEVVAFLVFWLIGWTAGGCFALLTVLWMLFGKEVIYSERATLVIEKKILGIKKSREYDINNVRNIRIVEKDTSIFTRRRGLEFYGVSGGLLNFDYGMKTIQFGINIDVAEANHLLEIILNSGVMISYSQMERMI